MSLAAGEVTTARAPFPARTASAPPGIRPTVRFLPDVEALRGLAILLVVLHHFDGRFTPHLATDGALVSAPWAFVAGGQTGVSLFFVLSAFCLSLPFFTAPPALGWRWVTGFYARRALRILPLYWLVVLAGAALSANSPADLSRALPWAFFLQSLPGLATPFVPYTNVLWSLATEVQFYLLLPLLPLALSSRRGRVLGGIAGAAAAASYVACVSALLPGAWPSTLEGAWQLALSLFGRGPVFAAGLAAAWLYARHGEVLSARIRRSAILAAGGADLVLVVLLTALTFLLRWQVGLGYWFAESRPVLAWHVPEGMPWAGVLLAVLLLPLRLRPLLSNRATRALGLWSYSIYLLHLPVMTWSLHWLGQRTGTDLYSWNPVSMAATVVVGAAIVAMSSQTYRWVERPFLVRKARL